MLVITMSPLAENVFLVLQDGISMCRRLGSILCLLHRDNVNETTTFSSLLVLLYFQHFLSLGILPKAV